MNVRLLMIMFLLAATISKSQIVEAFEKSKVILCRQHPALCGEEDVHSRRLECLRNPKGCQNGLYPEIHHTNVPIRTKTPIKNRPLNCRQHPALCKEDRHANVPSITKHLADVHSRAVACIRNPMACQKGFGPDIPIRTKTAIKNRPLNCRQHPAFCKEDRHTNVNSITKDLAEIHSRGLACLRNPMACHKGFGPEIHHNNVPATTKRPVRNNTAKPRRRNCRLDPAACIGRESFSMDYVPKSVSRNMWDFIRT